MCANTCNGWTVDGLDTWVNTNRKRLRIIVTRTILWRIEWIEVKRNIELYSIKNVDFVLYSVSIKGSPQKPTRTVFELPCVIFVRMFQMKWKVIRNSYILYFMISYKVIELEKLSFSFVWFCFLILYACNSENFCFQVIGKCASEIFLCFNNCSSYMLKAWQLD